MDTHFCAAHKIRQSLQASSLYNREQKPNRTYPRNCNPQKEKKFQKYSLINTVLAQRLKCTMFVSRDVCLAFTCLCNGTTVRITQDFDRSPTNATNCWLCLTLLTLQDGEGVAFLDYQREELNKPGYVLLFAVSKQVILQNCVP